MIRFASLADLPRISALIRALASYEKLDAEVVLDDARLAQHLFGPTPRAEVLLACAGVEVVGFALFFHNFSTFLGQPGLYLEDLFVEPAHRQHGHGRALLRELARLALARECGRLEWAVLDWNAPALAFYAKLGARPLTEWTLQRLSGAGLQALAG